MRSGYLNFFVIDSSSLKPTWVVQNLYVPPIIIDYCPPIIDDGTSSPNEPPSSAPDPNSTTPDPNTPSIPLSMYFDLRPDTEGSGGLDILIGNIVASEQPLPVIDDILNAVGEFPIRTIPVEQTLVNAEGHTKPVILPQSTIGSFSPDLNFIQFL